MVDQSAEVKKTLLAGIEILNPVLKPHGFVFRIESSGKGSGGHFAGGAYRKSVWRRWLGGHDRRLKLHFRYSLGLVTYSIGKDSLDHESYMRLLGVYGQNKYPDFPDNPLESFRSLAMDIQNFCPDFTSGDGKDFHALAAKLAENPAMFRGLP